MGGSKVLDRVRAGLGALIDIVNIFKDNISWMTNNKIIKQALDKLIEVNSMLDEEERKALQNVITACQMINTAEYRTRCVVTSLSGLVEVVLKALNCGMSYEKVIEPAIKLYIRRLDKDILPEIKDGCDAINDATNALIEVQKSIQLLVQWCERKKRELNEEKDSSAAKARGAAYGGAAGATAGVAAIVAATCWWNPIGWVAAVTATAAATTACAGSAFGISAGVVEGHQIKELNKIYSTSIDELTKASDSFKETVKKASDFQVRLEEKRNMLLNIHKETASTKDYGDLVLVGLDGMISYFKESLEQLYTSCNEYLNADIKKSVRW